MLSVWLAISEFALLCRPDIKEGVAKDVERETAPKPPEQKTSLKSEALMILWIAVFTTMILVFGFWVAIATFTPLFMFLFGRENWKLVALYTACVWVGVYLVFPMAMKVSLYGGVIGFSW